MTSRVGHIPLALILLIVGLACGLFVFATSPHTQPPKYDLLLSLLGFLAAAVWVDLIASGTFQSLVFTDFRMTFVVPIVLQIFNNFLNGKNVFVRLGI